VRARHTRQRPEARTRRSARLSLPRSAPGTIDLPGHPVPVSARLDLAWCATLELGSPALNPARGLQRPSALTTLRVAFLLFYEKAPPTFIGEAPLSVLTILSSPQAVVTASLSARRSRSPKRDQSTYPWEVRQPIGAVRGSAHPQRPQNHTRHPLSRPRLIGACPPTGVRVPTTHTPLAEQQESARQHKSLSDPGPLDRSNGGTPQTPAQPPGPESPTPG
jgi:hypothetical protein